MMGENGLGFGGGLVVLGIPAMAPPNGGALGFGEWVER